RNTCKHQHLKSVKDCATRHGAVDSSTAGRERVRAHQDNAPTRRSISPPAALRLSRVVGRREPGGSLALGVAVLQVAGLAERGEAVSAVGLPPGAGLARVAALHHVAALDLDPVAGVAAAV